ncbi:MAG TPA: hypothetical protein VMV19_03790 [Xanthobacteraceae bacterium]|nr:hypothetical protein [Xanthobacteraceae bacterium]
MRRVRGLKRGRYLSLFVAGFLGYLLGAWHGAPARSTDLSASQSVALRFPEANAKAAVVEIAADMPTGTVSTAEFKQSRLALSPQSMAPVVAAPTVQPPETVASPPPAAAMPPRLASAVIATPRLETKSAVVSPPRTEPKAPTSAAAVPHRANKRGFLLNDAQIAGIKERLHLTADQVRMWPAVEAALRNIAYAKERYARRHSAPAMTEVASIDPNTAEVQDLKSAAIPLIMSFSDEQKNEVRSLAHGMGLDQLASEF